MPTDRYLRPLSTPNAYAVMIDGQEAAHIIETREGFEIQTVRYGGWETIHTELGGTLVGLAERLAEGAFDDDFRYEINANPEPDSPSDLYFVARIAIPSQKVLERFTTDDPYREVEAAREAQAIPFEERMNLYAERGW